MDRDLLDALSVKGLVHCERSFPLQHLELCQITQSKAGSLDED